MKKIIISVVAVAFVLSLVTNDAFAATKKSSKSKKSTKTSVQRAKKGVNQDVFLNPFGLFFGLGMIGYEHTTGKDQSFTAGLSFASYSVVSMIGVSGSYRFWLNSPKKLEGFFVGPAAGILSIKYDWGLNWLTGKSLEETYTGINIGAEGGYQWVFKNNMLINVGLNLSYMAGSFDSPAGYYNVDFKYSGLFPSLLFNIGYAF